LSEIERVFAKKETIAKENAKFLHVFQETPIDDIEIRGFLLEAYGTLEKVMFIGGIATTGIITTTVAVGVMVFAPFLPALGAIFVICAVLLIVGGIVAFGIYAGIQCFRKQQFEAIFN
jgi:hypothetical protein